MSKIHSCWVAVACRSALMNGTAKYSTETSIETSSRGSARTASAIHSLRPAVGASDVVMSSPQYLRMT
jgi:hypothetical protein